MLTETKSEAYAKPSVRRPDPVFVAGPKSISYFLSCLHQTCMDDASCIALLMELKELDAESAS